MVVTTIVMAISTAGAGPAAGDAAKDAGDAQQLVERAKLTVESFAADGTVAAIMAQKHVEAHGSARPN